jgi:aerobic carbon-monoxide dehydrogenase medium subunit
VTFRLERAGSSREVSCDAFFVGPLTPAIEADELLVEVRLPASPPRTGTAFREIARTHGSFALVGVAAAVTLDAGVVKRVRLALCGVGGTPVRARGAEAALAGQAPTAATWVARWWPRR